MTDSAHPAAPAPAGASRRPSRNVSVIAIVTAAFGWLMCTLAAGAIAAFVGLMGSVRPCWPLLVLALPLAYVLKLCGCLGNRWAAPIAAAAVLLAGFYAECLAAVARIAAVLGFPFGLAFRTGGVGLTLQVAELSLNVIAVLAYAGAAVLAAIAATRAAR
ncbi:MAG TPA: hypothetical protein VFQ95_08530 [Rhodanobacteraceae bacterium]|nr:hypothetical protein [Rhodanobacteraceae bacterium]